MSHAIALIDRLVLSDLVPFRLISLANTTPIEIYILSLHDALPISAQYGFRTAGIIDIQTKTGTINPGGSVSMYGGSHEWLQPSFEWGGRVGRLDYFLTGDFLHNAIGIENPTSSYNPIHDRTDQGRGFAY